MKRAVYVMAWVVLVPAIWLVLASLAFLWLTDALMLFPPLQRPYVWAVYVRYFGRDLWESLYLFEAAAIASTPFIGIAVRFGTWSHARSKPLYGETHVAGRQEMAESGLEIRRRAGAFKNGTAHLK